MADSKRFISEAEQYLLDVQSGKITACKRIKQLAEGRVVCPGHGNQAPL